MVDRFNIGDEVKIQFNIKGSKWERDGRVNYITNLDAWRMENVKLGQDGASDASYTDNPPADVVDDLPF